MHTLLLRRARRSLAPALLSTLAIASATHARAHITAQPDQGTAGAYFETALKVPHGCDGASTVALRVTLPDGVTSVKPQMKPGWTIDIAMRPVDPPIAGEHGAAITETVASVEWRGGPLPDRWYDTFGLVMKLPATVENKTLYFPVVQTCEHGERAWTDIPAEGQSWHAVPSPAPFVRVVPAAIPKAAPHSMDHS